MFFKSIDLRCLVLIDKDWGFQVSIARANCSVFLASLAARLCFVTLYSLAQRNYIRMALITLTLRSRHSKQALLYGFDLGMVFLQEEARGVRNQPSSKLGFKHTSLLLRLEKATGVSIVALLRHQPQSGKTQASQLMKLKVLSQALL